MTNKYIKKKEKKNGTQVKNNRKIWFLNKWYQRSIYVWIRLKLIILVLRYT